MTKKLLVVSFFILVLAAISFAQSKDTSKKTPEAAPSAVRYGIVVDNSGSFRTIFERVVQTTKSIIEENKPDDKAFMIRFVDTEKVSVLQDLTDSKAGLLDATDEMFPEGGQTAILDAVEFSAKYLKKNSAESDQNKVLVLITDGYDRSSATKIEDLLKFLQTEKIRVFAVGISDEKVSSKLLEKLAKGTGGKVYLPRTQTETDAAIKELAAAIRLR